MASSRLYLFSLNPENRFKTKEALSSRTRHFRVQEAEAKEPISSVVAAEGMVAVMHQGIPKINTYPIEEEEDENDETNLYVGAGKEVQPAQDFSKNFDGQTLENALKKIEGMAAGSDGSVVSLFGSELFFDLDLEGVGGYPNDTSKSCYEGTLKNASVFGDFSLLITTAGHLYIKGFGNAPDAVKVKIPNGVVGINDEDDSFNKKALQLAKEEAGEEEEEEDIDHKNQFFRVNFIKGEKIIQASLAQDKKLGMLIYMLTEKGELYKYVAVPKNNGSDSDDEEEEEEGEGQEKKLKAFVLTEVTVAGETKFRDFTILVGMVPIVVTQDGTTYAVTNEASPVKLTFISKISRVFARNGVYLFPEGAPKNFFFHPNAKKLAKKCSQMDNGSSADYEELDFSLGFFEDLLEETSFDEVAENFHIQDVQDNSSVAALVFRSNKH